MPSHYPGWLRLMLARAAVVSECDSHLPKENPSFRCGQWSRDKTGKQGSSVFTCHQRALAVTAFYNDLSNVEELPSPVQKSKLP